GDHPLAFLGLEGADRIDKGSRGLQPPGGPLEQPRLHLRAVADDLWPGAIENLRMAPEGAGRRAGCVEEDGVELAIRLPGQSVRLDEVDVQMRAGKILPKSPETTCRSFHRSDPMTRGGELHRLSAG